MSEPTFIEKNPWIILLPVIIFVLSISIFVWIQVNKNPKLKHDFMTVLYQIFSFVLVGLRPFITLFSYIGKALLYIIPLHRIKAVSEKIGIPTNYNDAWRNKNLLTTGIISFVIIFGAVCFSLFAFGDESHKDTFGYIGTPIAFTFLALLVLYVFYIYFARKGDKTNPENVFPSDKPFREQARWTIKRSGQYLKGLIYLTIVLGLLGGLLYLAMSSPAAASAASSVLLILSAITLLTIIYWGIKDTKIIQKLMKNTYLQLLFHVLFLIPCSIIDLVDLIYKELKHTPRVVYGVLIAEILFIAGYFIIPILIKKLYVYNGFGSDDQNIQNELNYLWQQEIKYQKEKREFNKDFDKYPKIKNNNIFFQKVKSNNLTLESKEEELKAHIISYLCPSKGAAQCPTSVNTLEKVKDIVNRLRINEKKTAKLDNKLLMISDKRKKLQERLDTGNGALKSTILLMKPLSLKRHFRLADYQKLRVGGVLPVDDIKYNFSLSCWFYLHSNPPNFYKTCKDYDIINYSKKPKISYNPEDGLRILIQTKKDDLDTELANVVKKYLIKDVKLQKWNNLVINYVNGILDVFLDAKLVGTYKNVIPYNTADIIKIGDKSGILNGGICNVVFYNSHLSKKRIELNYNYLKNKNPPIL